MHLLIRRKKKEYSGLGGHAGAGWEVMLGQGGRCHARAGWEAMLGQDGRSCWGRVGGDAGAGWEVMLGQDGKSCWCMVGDAMLCMVVGHTDAG